MSRNNREGFVAPLSSSPFGPPPYPMVNCKMLMVEFETDRNEIERLTPKPLEPVQGNKLYAFIADNSQPPASMQFHEAAILQQVIYEGRQAVTVPYIWTSNDTAMLAGREVYGMAKLICDPDPPVRIEANEVFGEARRFGQTMYKLNMVIERAAEVHELPFGTSWVFARKIPSPDPERPGLKQVVWIELTDFVKKELWGGRGWAGFQYPSSSGIDRIKPVTVTNAWYGQFSWVLGWGKILKEEEVWETKEFEAVVAG
ncbi:MAG: acetoacetate decarboxylase family protein [Acidobacteria bacterium]|nr:acetoacetate decarboxylase family protein [Acidobacteriota bacterium]